MKAFSMMSTALMCLTKHTSVTAGAAQQAYCLSSGPNQRDLEWRKKDQQSILNVYYPPPFKHMG